MPIEFFHKLAAIWKALGTFNPMAFVVGLATLAGIVLLKTMAAALAGPADLDRRWRRWRSGFSA